MIDRIVNALEQIASIEGQRRDIEQEMLVTEQQVLKALQTLIGTGPVGFRITETALQPIGGKKMTQLKATVDLQILDDGKGVLFTLQPVNKMLNAVPLPSGDTVTGTSSAPASLTNPIPDPGDPSATPPRPADTTGLIFLSTVPTPVVDATGIVVTFSAAFGSTAANPIDVVADSSPVGFTISESAL